MVALTLAACGGKKEPDNTETIPPGELTLATLKRAAKDAGFTVNGGWFTLTNWTTLSNSKQGPEDGFQISVPKDGSNFMGIAVLEFATEALAEEYVAFAATPEAYFSGNIYRSGVFTVDINESLIADHEAKLMAVFENAGWENSASGGNNGEKPSDPDENVYMRLDKTNYAEGEEIVLTVSGITEQMESDRAFVAIYRSGAEHGAWGQYRYPKKGADQLEFTAPEEPGSYEMRLYRKDGEYTDDTFVLAAPFAVAGGSAQIDPNGNGETTPSGELTLDALKKAVQDLGYNTRDDFMPGFTAGIDPQAGFTATYTSDTSMGVYDIPFYEFRDNAEALAYKAENDAPDDFFPKECIVAGKFAAKNSSLSEASGAECKKFIEDVFEKASG